MSETPHLVSVIMSVYNSSMTVEESIKSILNQSYQNIELLICNDASNDETQNILEIFEKQDSRVRLFKNSENLGLTASLNI
jgi:glycosyltransferase EpsE